MSCNGLTLKQQVYAPAIARHVVPWREVPVPFLHNGHRCLMCDAANATVPRTYVAELGAWVCRDCCNMAAVQQRRRPPVRILDRSSTRMAAVSAGCRTVPGHAECVYNGSVHPSAGDSLDYIHTDF